MAVAEQEIRESSKGLGRVISVIGPVMDAEFPPDALPEIGYALEVKRTLAGTWYGRSA